MISSIFLSVREKATRLPKKVLLDIKGKSVTEHLIDRLKTSSKANFIVLCTSNHPDDTILVDIARKNGIKYFRGSEDDKLDRYLQAAMKFGVDYIQVVDGDDIFCDPVYIDKGIETFEITHADYITTKDLPLGAASFGIKTKALEKVCAIKAESDTEVWGSYLTDTGLFQAKYVFVEPELRHPEIRLTVDYKEDFDLIHKIFERLYVPSKVFTLKQIVKLLLDNPELLKINQKVQDLYVKNLCKSPQVKLKTDYQEILKRIENTGGTF